LIASLVLLTPWGLLLGLLAIAPLAALARAARHERRARELLRLTAPARSGAAGRALLVAAVMALLAVAAAQPAIRSTTTVHVRTDAEAFYVLDNSRSMLAARAPGAPTRLARARKDAVDLRQRLLEIPSGVATMTDHVLPDLFPVPDPGVFAQTVREAAQVGNPPPATNAVTATNLGALGALGSQSFFSPGVKHRVAVVLTDGESRPFDESATARALLRAPGVTLVLIRIGSGSEAVFDGTTPESAYHPDPAAAATVATLAQAAHGKAYGEGELDQAAAAVRAALGAGATHPEGTTVTTRTLAPWFALAALVPLLALVGAPLLALARARRSRQHEVPAQMQEAPALLPVR